MLVFCVGQHGCNLIKQFRQGVNPGDEFAFHFTSLEGGKGITSSGALNPTKYGLRGPGVYSGTTPTPSWALKHVPYSGWGLGNAPVRIPIKINPNMPVEYVNWPFKTAIFRTGSEPLKLYSLGLYR